MTASDGAPANQRVRGACGFPTRSIQLYPCRTRHDLH